MGVRASFHRSGFLRARRAPIIRKSALRAQILRKPRSSPTILLFAHPGTLNLDSTATYDRRQQAERAPPAARAASPSTSNERACHEAGTSHIYGKPGFRADVLRIPRSVQQFPCLLTQALQNSELRLYNGTLRHT